MKTTITSYIIFGGLLMLSSCAQEEDPVRIPDSGDRRIVFNTFLPDVTTKATGIVKDLPKFYLTAYNVTDPKMREGGKLKEYADSLTFEKNNNTGKYSNNDCIWPEPGQEEDVIHFFTYYPELNEGAKRVNSSSVVNGNVTVGYKVTGFQVAKDISSQIDFVTAHTMGNMAEHYFSGINLNFAHQLSRIEVKAWGANKNCDIEIAGVRIGGVNVSGDFDFLPADGTSAWLETHKGDVDYIYRRNNQLVTLSRNGKSHSSESDAISLMGNNLGDDNNCAMLLPTVDASGWDSANDRNNSSKNAYIGVLLRIYDNNGTQQYPYRAGDTNQGVNAPNIPIIYLTVDKATGKNVSRRLYKKDGRFYANEACTAPYTVQSTEEVKEFGWAALPITANWQAGYIYTYTLDYSYGIGLHAPDAPGNEAPMAGDPVISDKVGVSVSVNGWQGLNGSTTHDFVVPGS